jgi:putative ABC transport system permease protein
VFYVLGLVTTVGVIGASLGTAVGVWFSRSMVEMYKAFYSFPVLVFDLDPSIVVTAIGVSLGFCVLGATSAAFAVARLKPAEGMRPEAPKAFKRTWVERWTGLWKRLGFVWRMVVRGISRARLRSAVTVLGVALAASIMLLAFYTRDAIDVLMDFQYAAVERQDVHVAFNDARGRASLYEIRRLPGVRTAEPELIVPVRLKRDWREHRSALQGLDADGVLRGLMDRRSGAVPLPRDGLLLSSKLAEMLDVNVGEDVAVEVLDGEKAKFTTHVAGLVDEYIGTSAYVDIRRLSRWIGEEDAVTGAFLRVDPAEANRLDRELKRLPAVGSAVFKTQSRENFEDSLAESMDIMTGTLTLFAGIIAFGVIYNAARITLEVRRRELASLRVLGFTKREVAAILHRESLLLAAFAIPLGTVFGTAFCKAMASLYDTDLFRFPVVVTENSVILTALWVIGFTLAAGLLVGRRVAKLDLVEVLKARE